MNLRAVSARALLIRRVSRLITDLELVLMHAAELSNDEIDALTKLLEGLEVMS